MKIFKKKENDDDKIIQVDENGKVVKPERKKVNMREIGKKVVLGLGCLVVGAAAFLAVGVAMTYAGDISESTSIDTGDGIITFNPKNEEETSESSEEETSTEGSNE